MKSIHEIKEMSLEELETISLDGKISSSEDLAGRAMTAVRRQHQRRIAIWSSGIAASIALIAGIGLSSHRRSVLQDSFSDPRLAYAEVEKAFSRIGAAISSSTETLNTSTDVIDNRLDKVFHLH